MAASQSIEALFVAHAPDLLALAGLDGRFRQVNPSWTRTLGWSADELLAMPWPDLVHPDDREASLAVAAALRQGRLLNGFENRCRCRDGSYRRLLWNAFPLPDDPALFIATARDVTDDRALREQLAQARDGLAAIIDHAPLGVHLWESRADGALVLIAANAAADRFTGVRNDVLVGLTIEQAFPATVALGIPERYRAVAEGRAPGFSLMELPYDDGRIRGWFDVWCFPAGRSRAAACFVEVTERRNQQEALRSSREDLRITLDSIGDGVIATDRNGIVTRVNRVASLLTGWDEREAVGEPIERVFALVDAANGRPAESPVDRVLREGLDVGLADRVALVRRDAAQVRIAHSGAPIRDADGKVAGVVLVFRDISAEHALQRHIHQMQKMEAVGRLAGGIAHDFNNMLGGILGAADLLARPGHVTEPALRWVELIRQCTARASGLTGKLLAFGRRSPSQTVITDLALLVRQTADILAHTIERTIAVRVEAPDAPVWVKGDPSQLQSALINLAINARDAMAGGGHLRIALEERLLDGDPPCRHLVGAIASGACAAIVVSDSGTGIADGIIERIFEPFFTTKGPGEGTGLGLASVYATALSHGGAVGLDTAVGQGATFTLWLPRCAAPEPMSGIRPALTPTAGGGRRILIAEDEEALRVSLAAWLTDAGYTVETAADGETALARCAARPAPDAVLLDLVMPGRPATELFRAIRERLPGRPILLMSGYNLHGLRAEALLADGGCEFLQKPFRLEQLAAALQRALR